jgi:hypothetical protein
MPEGPLPAHPSKIWEYVIVNSTNVDFAAIVAYAFVGRVLAYGLSALSR